MDGTGPSGSSTISGTTTANLTIANPQFPLDQEGNYSLISAGSNSAGMATNTTVLTVIAASDHQPPARQSGRDQPPKRLASR